LFLDFTDSLTFFGDWLIKSNLYFSLYVLVLAI
jgi:hypothetical protein